MENFMIRKRQRYCGYCRKHFDMDIEDFMQHINDCEYILLKFAKKNPTEPTEGEKK